MTAWLLYLAGSAIVLTAGLYLVALAIDHPGRHEARPLDPADQETVTWLTTELRDMPEPPAPSEAALLPWVQAILGAPTVDAYIEQNWKVTA